MTLNLRISSLFLLLLLSIADRTQAFIFNAFTALPALQELAKTQTDTELSIRLEIGSQHENHLLLDGLTLECLQTKAPKSSVCMPGADGPHPQTSSGKREVHFTQLPYYIGMKGKEEVHLEHKAAWEMIWKVDDRQGLLIIGFDNPCKVTRNDQTAQLHPGRLYLSFPIWTQELLDSAQVKKAEAFERRDELVVEKDRFLSEMQATNNLLKKAMLYRDAAEAFEKMDLTGWRWYQWVPDSDGVVPMGNQVLVGQEGTIFSKGFDRFSAKKILGKAMIRPRLVQQMPIQHENMQSKLLP
ncbi:hypothetical protein MPSEU_000370400 [Mayamaea pseudoterrestris]|nr:hypothetical protein MPSEU_000370400 [Mayamaea pseudoterrestris]